MKKYVPCLGLATLAAAAGMTGVTVKARSPVPQPAVFARCAACHSVAQGQPNKAGPNLFSAYGRKAGAVSDYSYSKALKSSGAVWNRATLNKFLINPDSVAKGGKMPAQPMSAVDREAVIKYMATLK